MGGNNLFVLLGYIVFFAALMYFMIIMPQKKRDKKAREMMDTLQVGYKASTIGGIVGKIINIKDDEVTVETSVEKTQIVVKKWAIKESVKPE